MQETWDAADQGGNSRGIIFVRTRASAHALASLLQSSLPAVQACSQCKPFAGLAFSAKTTVTNDPAMSTAVLRTRHIFP